MKFRRIVAGILASLIIAAQVPEAHITALAAEDLLLDKTEEIIDDHDHEHDHEHVEAIPEELGSQGNPFTNLGEGGVPVIDSDPENEEADEEGTEEDAADDAEQGQQVEQQPGSADGQEGIESQDDKPFSATGDVSFDEKKVTFEEEAPAYEIEELTANEKRLYDILKPEIDKIAAGSDPAENGYIIEVCQVLNDKLVYTYEELEVATTEDSQDPVADTAALNDAVKKLFRADLEKVSSALMQGSQGSVTWIPTQIRFTRDAQNVYLTDDVLWTVYVDAEAADDKQDPASEDEDKETEEDELKADEELKTDEELESDDDTDEAKETALTLDTEEADKSKEATLTVEELETDALKVDMLSESKISAEGLNVSLFASLEDDEDQVPAEDLDAYEVRTQGLWVAGIEEEPYPYQLKPVTIDNLRVYFDKKLLKEGTDYTVAYKNNTKPGTATVTVTGKGNYTGSVTNTFAIVKDDFYTSNQDAVAFTAAKVYFEDFTDSFVYSGEAQYPDVSVYYNGEILGDEDYVVTYSKEPVNVGTYTATYTGIGGYKGSIKKNFKITAEDINNATLYGLEDGDEVYFRKGGAKADIRMEYGDMPLQLGTDYTVSYKNNAKLDATGTLTITGKGNFRSSFKRTFTVTQNLDSESLSFTVADKAFANKAGNYITSFALTDNDGKKLAAGPDYIKTVKYTYEEDTVLPGGIMRYAGDEAGTEDIVPAGVTMRLTVTLTGNYDGEVTDTYRITGQDISKATVKVVSQYYTGKEIKPDASQITVTLGKTVLSANDYEIISYENNTDKGTGKLTIRGKGEYGGTKTATFTIAARTTAFSIVFYGNGATGGSMNNQSIALSKNAKLSANKFTRNNYVFAGWNTEADGTGTAYDNLHIFECDGRNSGDVLILYAQWTRKEVPDYTITYHFNDGTDDEVVTYNALSDDIYLEAIPREDWDAGYQFGGWYKESTFKTRVSVIKSGSTGNVNVYAKWIPYSYTVKFNGSGATSGVMADQGFSYGVGKKLTKNAFKKNGYAFAGWSTIPYSTRVDYTDAQEVKDLPTVKSGLADAITLYAVWKNDFEITYDCRGGALPVGCKNLTYTYGVGLNLSVITPHRDGYVFAGWYKDPEYKTKITSIAKNSTGDITVYAKWTPKSFKIVYMGGDGASGKTPAQTVKTEEATIAASKFTYPGKKFIGWSKSRNAAEPEFYTGQLVGRDDLLAMPEEDTVTLFAVWGDVTRSSAGERTFYNVIFERNSVDVEGNPINPTGRTATQKINRGEYKSLTKNGYSLKGWEFLGWSEDPDATEATYANTEQVKDLSFDENTGNAVLFAIWEKQVYTITYHNVIDEEKGIPDYTVDDTAKAAVGLYTPSQIGRTFAGWYSDAALKKKVNNIAKGSTGNKDFYAKWTYNYYTISYNLNDRDSDVKAVLDTTKAGYVSSYGYRSDNGYVLATAKREGYRFGGWYLDAACKKPVTFITGAPTVDMTVYAKWISGCAHGQWVSAVEAPTCTEDGVNGWACGYCGQPKESDIIPRTGHSFNWEETRAATVTMQGEERYVCSVCGYVELTRVIEKLPCSHEWGEGTVTKEATIKSSGSKFYTCAICGATRTEVIPMIGHTTHTFGAPVITLRPTCTEEGVNEYTCLECGFKKTEPIPAKGHTEPERGVVTKAPSFTEEGLYEIKCVICNEVLRSIVVGKTPCYHPNDSLEIVVTKEATCTEAGARHVTCTLCGYDQVEEIPAKGHVEGTRIIKSATYTEEGESETYCLNCDAVLKTEVIPKLTCNHPHYRQTKVTVKEPTCTEEGIAEEVCEICGNVETKTISATGHGRCSRSVSATCAQEGVKETYCNKCGEVFESEIIPKRSHSEFYRTVKEATYKEDGLKEYYCINCKEILRTEVLPKKECSHTSKKKIVITEATCTEKAVVKTVCSQCDQLLEDTHVDESSRLADHSYGDVVLTGSGDEEQYYLECTRCGYTKKGTVKWHSHLYVLTEKTPHGEDGYCDKTQTCIICGEIKTSSIYEGHDTSGDYVVEKAATCTESGEKVKRCPVCGKVVSTLTISKTGHVNLDYELIKEADCNNPAHYKVTCRDCGEVVKADYYDLNGEKNPDAHNYSVSRRTEATVTSEGQITYQCSRCYKSYSEIIPKLPCPHEKVEDQIINMQGYEVCTTCKEIVGTFDAQTRCEHKGGWDYVIRVEADATTWGETDRYCLKCGKVLETKLTHPIQEYHVIDQNGEEQIIYGWFDDEWAMEVWQLTSQYRQENGLSALTYNESLQNASNVRALEALVFWGHDRPDGSKWNSTDAIWASVSCGENLAKGANTPEEVMVAWKNSPGHNRNMLLTPWRAMSVSCFHQVTKHYGGYYEYISWDQHFTARDF